MNANQITVTVPPEIQDQVGSWEDGKSYDVSIKQDGAGQFTLVSVEGESDAENADETGAAGADDNAPDTSKMPSKNPAIAIVMAKK